MSVNNKWDKLEKNAAESERIWGANRTFAGDVWHRFRHKPTALLGLVLIFIMVVFAWGGPVFYKASYEKQWLEFVNIPPTFKAFPVENGYIYVNNNLKAIAVGQDGRLVGSLEQLSEDMMKKQITFAQADGSTAVLSYKVKPPALLDESGTPRTDLVSVRNKSFLLGTDNLGRDLLARLMYGARISLVVAFIAATVNLLIGILYGGISGYLGGTVDGVMMRIVDIISTIPLTLYVILIMVVLNSGFLSIVIALGSVYWVNMARVVRGQVLTLRERDFVYAARTMGTSTWNILIRHLIPNAMGPILVTVTMLIPTAIFMEAFMSFIGLGIAPPMASLGTMCNSAIETLRTQPYQLFMPAFVISLLMFAFNFVGDGLRDALDPQLRR